MNRVKLIGLTGQTGAGKSTVAGVLAQRGFAVISADALVRTVYANNAACLRAVAATFGQDVLTPGGALDRRVLAKRAFATKENTAMLGAIVHPFVFAETLKILKTISGAAVFDAPQLFESNIDAVCDLIVSVTARDDVRLARILRRDGITAEQARERMDAQYSEAFFRERSDVVIENNGSLDALTGQLEPVIARLRTEVG